jgi:hypothetical protein
MAWGVVGVRSRTRGRSRFSFRQIGAQTRVVGCGRRSRFICTYSRWFESLMLVCARCRRMCERRAQVPVSGACADARALIDGIRGSSVASFSASADCRVSKSPNGRRFCISGPNTDPRNGRPGQVPTRASGNPRMRRPAHAQVPESPAPPQAPARAPARVCDGTPHPSRSDSPGADTSGLIAAELSKYTNPLKLCA